MFAFGGLGVLSQKIFLFLSSLDLIYCIFSLIFAHFQTKRDITRGGGGAKPFSGGGGGGNIGAGRMALAPSIYVKKGPEAVDQ